MNNNSVVMNNAAWLADGGPRPPWKPINWHGTWPYKRAGFWPMPDGAINTYR